MGRRADAGRGDSGRCRTGIRQRVGRHADAERRRPVYRGARRSLRRRRFRRRPRSTRERPECVVPRGWTARQLDRRSLLRRRAIPSSSRWTTRPSRCRRWRTAFARSRARKVVAITGSAGKTTTKEVTSEFLEARYRVVRNHGNFNNHIGLPLSLIELRQRPDIAVVELGMNHAGEISTLVHVAEPDVRVWTNVGEAHLGFFASVDAIADAKAEILEGAERGDAAGRQRGRSDASRARIGAFRGRVVTFGIDRRADVRATDVVDRGIEGTSARASRRQAERWRSRRRSSAGRTWPTSLPRPPWPRSSACRWRKSRRARRSCSPPRIAAKIVRLANGVTVDRRQLQRESDRDQQGARRADGRPRRARRIAVLGEMLELGDRSAALHAAVGRAAANARRRSAVRGRRRPRRRRWPTRPWPRAWRRPRCGISRPATRRRTPRRRW